MRVIPVNCVIKNCVVKNCVVNIVASSGYRVLHGSDRVWRGATIVSELLQAAG